MKKLYLLVFTFTLISSTLMVMSSSSWMMMWMGMEINLISFIPLIHTTKNTMSTETSTKYFIIQAMASSFLLLAVNLMMMKLDYSQNTLESKILSMAMMTKMGMSPFHFWFPSIIEGLNWSSCMIMLTWQKIAPMTVMSYTKTNNLILITAIIASTLMSSMLTFNQTKLRKIMAYSSINHMSWMTSLMLTSKYMWMWYLIIYSMMSISTMTMFSLNKMFSLKQAFKIKSMQEKLAMILNMISMAGIPPMSGFLLKWITIQMMLESKLFLLSIILISSTTIMAFVYSRLIIPMMIMKTEISMWNKLIHNKNSLLISIFSNTTIIPWMILMNFM